MMLKRFEGFVDMQKGQATPQGSRRQHRPCHHRYDVLMDLDWDENVVGLWLHQTSWANRLVTGVSVGKHTRLPAFFPHQGDEGAAAEIFGKYLPPLLPYSEKRLIPTVAYWEEESPALLQLFE